MSVSTPGKIGRRTFHRLVRAGKSNREIARHFGVSDSAVSQFKKAHQAATTKNVVLRQAGRLLKEDLNLLGKTCSQERRLAAAAELAWKITNGDQQALKTAQDVRSILPRTQFSDPLAIYLKAIQQLTDLLKVKRDIMASMYDVEVAAKFQREIMEILADASPELRRVVIRRLRENRALATSLKTPAISTVIP